MRDEEDYNRYFVVYDRDVETEKRKEEYKESDRMLYDRMRHFESQEGALRFMGRNLPALCAELLPVKLTPEDKGMKYIVVAEHYGKYNSYHYDGSSTTLTSFDAFRCEKSELEELVEELSAEEHVRNIHVGLEVRLY